MGDKNNISRETQKPDSITEKVVENSTDTFKNEVDATIDSLVKMRGRLVRHILNKETQNI